MFFKAAKKTHEILLSFAFYCNCSHYSRLLVKNSALFTKMSHGQFIVACESAPLGFLISTPKTLRILLVHKIRDTRFQLLLFNWTCSILALVGAGVCGFRFMPMILAVGVVAEGVFFFFFVLCIDAGDILLDLVREDEVFFELATRCQALGIFEDTEFAPPQSVN